MPNTSVVVLTFNSEATIGATLASALRVSDDVHVVDSFSADRTLEISESYGAHVIQHEFEHYGAQRNWAIDHLPLKNEWELHLDADEALSEELIKEINALQAAFPVGIDGYLAARLPVFLGRPIRHGGMYPIWHLRLFRHGMGKCEDRAYDQHFYVLGRVGKLKGPLIDNMRMNLTEWVNRHNRWATAEARELASPSSEGVVAGKFRGNPVERKRAFRNMFNRMPLFIRAFLLFFYRYFLRLGVLDGKEGLIFFVLQAFWFRFLVDAKLYEMKHEEARLEE